MKRFLRYFSFLLLCAILQTTGQAQITTASISGLVSEVDGEELIAATVVATHEPSGTQYGITTRENGRYTLPNLRPGGPYKVVVSYVGYKDQTVEQVQLSLGQNLTLDFELESATTVLGEIVVTSDANAIMNGDRTGAGTNVSSRQLRRMPTISRSAGDFTRLTPASDGNSFAGRNDQFNNFSLDGSIFNNPFGLDAATPGGQTSAQPVSLDAIDQITVNIAPYDVTQSGFTGASVNAVTKSGTNRFQGVAFAYFRNDGLTGSKVMGEEITVPDLEQFQYGFSLGGPIIKNKLFFFINAENDSREDLGTTWIPQGSGTTSQNVSRVTLADMQAVANALSSYGYDPGMTSGYLHESNSTKGIAKLDWAINQNHTLTATYNFLDADKDKPAHPSALGRRGPDFTTLQFQNSGYEIRNKISSGILELRSILGNKMSNNLQVGFTKFTDSRDPFSTPFPVLNINKDGVRYIVAGHEPFSIHNRLDQDVFQITNNFNIYTGDHTITVGASFERFNFDNSFNLGVYEPFGWLSGSFGPGYPSVDSFLVDIASGAYDAAVDNAQAVFNANGGDSGVEGEGWALAETNLGQIGIYVQDKWQATPNLNLTLGLRVDIPQYFNTSDLIQENIDRNCCHVPGVEWFDEDGNTVVFDHTELPSGTTLFSPRFGFNWDVMGDQSTQLRGGSGLFSGRLPFVWIGNQVANPNIFFYTVTDPDFKFLQVWRTNLGLDKTMGDGWIGSVDLMYTKDLQAPMVRNYGIRPPTGRLGGVDNRPIYLAEDRAVDPFTNAYVLTNVDEGYSFNASFKVEKQFGSDMHVMLGYNYLKAEDVSSIEAEISSDAYDRNPAFGNVNNPALAPSLYGAQHRIIGSFYKRFTYGPESNTSTHISAFFTYGQGGTTNDDNLADFRFSYTYGGDLNGDGSGLNDLLYIPTDSELNDMRFVTDGQREAFRRYIQQDEYLSENRGSYAEKYAILAPWYSQWDLRIMQDFAFHAGEEPNHVQISLDIFNVGNLISSDWGVRELPNNSQPVGIIGFDANNEPTYAFDESLTSTFSADFSLLSRWQAQLGLRYIF